MFEELAILVELQVQKLLEEHNYNTVGNFLGLYNDFQRSGARAGHFSKHFQRYTPPITSNHHTCVGLALELWTRLSNCSTKHPNLSSSMYLVSCEEHIEALGEYMALSGSLDTAAYDLEKEHVLLCIRIEVNGRPGLILSDPGYHVGRVVTVMQDKEYPHTGWFQQAEEGGVRKDYNYQYSTLNGKFVEWQERTARNGVYKTCTGLVYVAKPYLTAIDVTERRNLVYNFRSLLSRDQKGHLIAGIYFKVRENCDEFTLFYQDMGKQRVTMKFSTFLQTQAIKEKTLNIVTICNEQLNLPNGGLLKMLKELAKVMSDHSYVRELLEVNKSICLLSANN